MASNINTLSDAERLYKAKVQLAAGHMQVLDQLLHSEGWALMDTALELQERTALEQAMQTREGLDAVRNLARYEGFRRARLWPRIEFEACKKLLLGDAESDVSNAESISPT